MIAQEAAQLRRGGQSGNDNAAKTNGARAPFVSEAKTMDEVADEFGVSRDTIQRARLVAENGAPQLIAAVKAGEIPVKAVARCRLRSQPGKLAFYIVPQMIWNIEIFRM